MTPKGFFGKLFSTMVVGNLIAMAVVLILVVVGAWIGLDHYTLHGQGIEVPDVSGMLESDARYALGRSDLEMEVADSAYTKDKPRGSIIDQTPAAGTKVKAGRVIYVTINSGKSPTRILPDISDNSSLREAQAKLLAMGFKLGPVEYVSGDKDWVYGVKCRGQNVSTGDRIPLDVPLVLQVGNDPGDTEMDEDSIDVNDEFDF